MSNNTIIESCQVLYSKGKQQNRECTITLDADNTIKIFYRKNQILGRAVAQSIGGLFAQIVYSDITDHGMTYLEKFYVSDIDNIKRSPNPNFTKGWRFYLKDGNSFDITMEPDFLNALSKAISIVKEGQQKQQKKAPETKVEYTTHSSLNEPDFDISHLPAPLRRAFILLEDCEWEKADSYLERILDIEPENAYAYLGKLMVSKRINRPSQLKNVFPELKDNKYFNRVYTYADGELKEYITWIIRNNDPIETSTKEEPARPSRSSEPSDSSFNHERAEDQYKHSEYQEYMEYEPPQYNESEKTQNSSSRHSSSGHLKNKKYKKKKIKTFPLLIIFVILIASAFFGKTWIGYSLLEHGHKELASKLILLDDYSATKFLKGTWIATGGEQFSVDDNGHLKDGLPTTYSYNDINRKWVVWNSILKNYTAINPKKQNDKKLSILSLDRIQIYCYENGQTYTLKRQKNPVKNQAIYSKTYTVTFDKNGGAGGVDYVIANYDETMPSGLMPPTKEGYIFKGYYSEKENGTRYYDEYMRSTHSWTSKNDGILYAHWEKDSTEVQNVYRLTFDKQGGTGGSDYATVKYNEQFPSGLTPPTKKGYRFTGYYLTGTSAHKYYDENMKSKDIWHFNEDRTFYAHWVEDNTSIIKDKETIAQEEYRVTFDKQGGSGGSDYVIVQYDSPMSSYLKPPKREGYRFLGYYSSPDNTIEQFYTPYMTNIHRWDSQSDGILYAHWEKIT